MKVKVAVQYGFAVKVTVQCGCFGSSELVSDLLDIGTVLVDGWPLRSTLLLVLVVRVAEALLSRCAGIRR